MDFQEYFYEVWQNLSFSVVSNEYRQRNLELIESVTYDLYRLHDQNGRLDIDLSRVILTGFFTSLSKIGVK